MSYQRSSIVEAPEDLRSNGSVIYKMRRQMKKIKSMTIDDAYDPTKTYGSCAIQEEEIQFGNELRVIRRVYVLNSSYKVGWVVDCDMERCMICLDRFNWLKFKHHCRACGNLVCSSCSPFIAYIPNFEEEDGSRVCRNCFGLKQSTANIVERSPSRMSVSNSSSPLISPLKPNDTMSTKAAGINSKMNTFTTANPSVTARPSRKAMLSRNGRLLLYDIEENPEEMLERQTEEYIREFETKQLPLNKLAYEVMRGIIPVDITRSSYSKLLSVYSECNSIDHPEELAERIWNTKILWLICMHPDDIQKLHIADLRSKYAFSGLDIVEMRAIYYALPKSWDSTRNSRKASLVVQQKDCQYEPDDVVRIQKEIRNQLAPKIQWKYDFKQKLMELILKEDDGLLSTVETRNPAYGDEGSGGIALFDVDVPLRPMFYRAASIHKHSVMDTPPPGAGLGAQITAGSCSDLADNTRYKHASMSHEYEASQVQGQGEGDAIDSNLDGFSLISPQRTEQYRGNSQRPHNAAPDGETFMDETDDEDGDLDITMMSPETPGPGTGFEDGIFETPEHSENRMGAKSQFRSGETTSSSMSNQSVTSPLAPFAANGENSKNMNVFMENSPGDMDAWDMTLVPMPDDGDDIEDSVEGAQDGWTDDKIEAAMEKISLEECRQKELEAEMEAEIERNRELKAKQQEKILVKAATMYNNEVSKAVRRASLTPLLNGRNSPTPVPGGVGVAGDTDTLSRSLSDPSDVVGDNGTKVQANTPQSNIMGLQNDPDGVMETTSAVNSLADSQSSLPPSSSTIADTSVYAGPAQTREEKQEKLQALVQNAKKGKILKMVPKSISNAATRTAMLDDFNVTPERNEVSRDKENPSDATISTKPKSKLKPMMKPKMKKVEV